MLISCDHIVHVIIILSVHIIDDYWLYKLEENHKFI